MAEIMGNDKAYEVQPPSQRCTCGHEWRDHGAGKRVGDGAQFVFGCEMYPCACREFTTPHTELTIQVTPEQHRALEALRAAKCWDGCCTAFPNLESVVEYLVACATDGLRRSGSWEDRWLVMAFDHVVGRAREIHGMLEREADVEANRKGLAAHLEAVRGDSSAGEAQDLLYGVECDLRDIRAELAELCGEAEVRR